MFVMAVLTLILGVGFLGVFLAAWGAGLMLLGGDAGMVDVLMRWGELGGLSYVGGAALIAGSVFSALGLTALVGGMINPVARMYAVCVGVAFSMLMIVTTVSGPMSMLSMLFGGNVTNVTEHTLLALMCLGSAAYAVAGAVLLAPRRVDTLRGGVAA